MLSGDIGDVRHVGSKSSTRTARPPQMASQQDTVMISNPAGGGTGHVSRSATAPAPKSEIPIIQPTPIPVSRAQELSALGLDLGAPARKGAVSESLDSTHSRSGPVSGPPTSTILLRPAPHRQLLALRRPAITPRNSTDNLANTLTLGRKLRDLSTTDLKTRFEPATYPLPESQSSATRSQTSASGVKPIKTSGEPTLSKPTSAKSKNHTETNSVQTPIINGTAGPGVEEPKKGKKKGKGKGKNVNTTSGPAAIIDAITANQDPAAWPVGPVPNPVLSVLDLSGGVQSQPSQMSPPPILLGVQSPPAPFGSQEVPRRDSEIPLSPPSRSSPEYRPPHHSQSLAPSTSLSSPPGAVPQYLRSPEIMTKGGPVNRMREDDDRVSFEVPNGTRGRLRVSLAWFRDRARSQQDRTTRQIEESIDSPPPPVPPKFQSHPMPKRPRPDFMDSLGVQEQDRQPHMSRRPSPTPQTMYPEPAQMRRSPQRSPINLDQRPYNPYDTFGSQPTLPTYPRPIPAQTPAMPPFQMNHPLAYPQPQPHPGWSSHPQLIPPQVQFQIPPQQAQGSRRAPPSMESFDPPSAANTPPMPHMGLPGVSMGLMGMQSGFMNPYAPRNISQGLIPPTPSRIVGQGQSQSQRQGQGQGGTYGRIPIWKRMFNSRPDWGDNNGEDQYRYDDNGRYGGNHLNGGGFGSDKVGKWMRGITPGRAPPPRTQNGTGAARGYGAGDGKDYGIPQSFLQRGFSFNRNNINRNGYASDQPQQQNTYQDHLDTMNPQSDGRSGMFGNRQGGGGVFDRMFTSGTRRQRRLPNQGELYTTNQSRPTTAFDARDRYKEARRREKQDRRNARVQIKINQQSQGQGQGLSTNPYGQAQRQGRDTFGRSGISGGGVQREGRSQLMVRDWVGRLGNGGRTNLINGYGPQVNGDGRKLRSGKRWKDRLPRSGNNAQGWGQEQRQGQGLGQRTNVRSGLGLLGIGKGLQR